MSLNPHASWLEAADEGLTHETRESSCIKCGIPMDVPFDYIGQPWCSSCEAKDQQIAKHYRPKARTA